MGDWTRILKNYSGNSYIDMETQITFSVKHEELNADASSDLKDELKHLLAHERPRLGGKCTVHLGSRVFFIVP